MKKKTAFIFLYLFITSYSYAIEGDKITATCQVINAYGLLNPEDLTTKFDHPGLDLKPLEFSFLQGDIKNRVRDKRTSIIIHDLIPEGKTTHQIQESILVDAIHTSGDNYLTMSVVGQTESLPFDFKLWIRNSFKSVPAVFDVKIQQAVQKRSWYKLNRSAVQETEVTIRHQLACDLSGHFAFLRPKESDIAIHELYTPQNPKTCFINIHNMKNGVAFIDTISRDHNDCYSKFLTGDYTLDGHYNLVNEKGVIINFRERKIYLHSIGGQDIFIHGSYEPSLFNYGQNETEKLKTVNSQY